MVHRLRRVERLVAELVRRRHELHPVRHTLDGEALEAVAVALLVLGVERGDHLPHGPGGDGPGGHRDEGGLPSLPEQPAVEGADHGDLVGPESGLLEQVRLELGEDLGDRFGPVRGRGRRSGCGCSRKPGPS